MAKRVLRFLKETINYSLKYEKEDSPLTAYVDSDWAGDASDRKSCTGYVMQLAGSPISWKSKKQRSVALSTMEAEYMALSEVIRYHFSREAQEKGEIIVKHISTNKMTADVLTKPLSRIKHGICTRLLNLS